MLIIRYSIEHRIGTQNHEEVITARDWTAIEAAIRELDGQRKTLVTLEIDDETHMAIGGGNENNYIVYATFDNKSFYNLIDHYRSDTDKAIVVGGQMGIYPAQSCIKLDQAIQAAKTFALTGKLEPALNWEKEGILESV
jgi:Immunity protein Imm1